MYQVYRTGDEWLTICHLSGERLIQMRGEWTNHQIINGLLKKWVSLLISKAAYRKRKMGQREGQWWNLEKRWKGETRRRWWRGDHRWGWQSIKWGEDKVSHLNSNDWNSYKALNFKSHSVSAYTVYTGWSHSIRVYIKKNTQSPC